MNKLLCFVCSIFITCACCYAEVWQDDVAKVLPKDSPKPFIYHEYNFESTERVPVTLKVIDSIRSETEVYEGQQVKFKVAKSVTYKGENILERGDVVLAKVAIIITPGMNGIPASIIFSEFKPADITLTGQFSENYEVHGQDRSLLVFPLKWALTFLPPTGSLTNFIMGGHAKLKENKLITIHYYPEWK